MFKSVFLVRLVFLCLCLGLLGTGAACAHAIVIDSSPKAGSIHAPLPFDAAIRFNSRIDIGRSSLMILDANRQVTPISIKPTTEPDLLQGLLPPLAPGRYRLRWQVLALDGHITRGDIPFTIQQ